MAGYRRFIAYVYEYLKGKKENNCGFIKVEVRDQRCRLEVHLQCPGIPAQTECKIYGFVRNGGLMDGSLLDTFKTGEGTVEFLVETDALNMSGTGVGLGKMGGIILKTESGAFFGTEWDDVTIRPENFREVRHNTAEVPTEKPAEKREVQLPPVETEEATMKKPAEMVPLRSDEGEPEQENEMPSAEVSRPERNESFMHSDEEEEWMPKYEMTKETGSADAKMHSQDIDRAEAPAAPEVSGIAENLAGSKASAEAKAPVVLEMPAASETPAAVNASVPPSDVVIRSDRWAEENARTEYSEERSQGRPQPIPARRPSPGKNEEDDVPFGDGEFADCRKIQLKDLARLHRRDAGLRNNRFLQYGYYNFGHLLLCRRGDGRYILGIPGGYNQQERFMANMFGFPYFKESRNIQLPKGRGGYWYRLINTPDFH